MLVVANPSSRSGRGKKLWPFFQRRFAERGVAFTWRETSSGDDCVAVAAAGKGVVVAAGGDGTINNVLNGVLGAGSGASMGVLYTGTSPDFCRFHGIPADPEGALAVLLEGKGGFVDLARIVFGAEGGRARHFACSCNIGLGAFVARFANQWRGRLGDFAGTGLGLILAMLRHRPFAAEVVVDGTRHVFQRANHIIVLKNPYVASGLRLDADIAPDDGKLLAVVVYSRSRLGLLGVVRSLYAGTLLRQKNVSAFFCASAAIETGNIQDVEFDGDAHGQTPVAITVAPGALRLIHGRKA